MCNEPITDIRKLPKHIQSQVYKPGNGEVKTVDLKFDKNGNEGFGDGQSVSVDVELDE